ncbi:hypothetical protein [Francisella hispaniensis]|uniref:Uncharacterized protein n=1 Tax=Francisella hispaniensis TaxID=622488 RepID=F4BFV6_9GAMM|nr:hypothetical protein [Francisella hispaniensis]AEE26350.1 hypothetical protein FN3523_1047 [Francisella hispaniensis]
MSDTSKKIKKWDKPILIILKNSLTPELEGKNRSDFERTFGGYQPPSGVS